MIRINFMHNFAKIFLQYKNKQNLNPINAWTIFIHLIIEENQQFKSICNRY